MAGLVGAAMLFSAPNALGQFSTAGPITFGATTHTINFYGVKNDLLP